MTAEPLRVCSKCGHLAYRFRPCHICALFAAHDKEEAA